MTCVKGGDCKPHFWCDCHNMHTKLVIVASTARAHSDCIAVNSTMSVLCVSMIGIQC